MDENIHRVRFSNLIDSKTGEPVHLEVPNDLVYEGSMLYWGFCGSQAGKHIKEILTKEEE